MKGQNKQNPQILGHSKLGLLLSKLSKEELKSLRKFIHCPWAEVNAPTAKLFDKLTSGTRLTTLQLPKETLVHNFGTDLKTFNKMMNCLLKAVEKFLVHQELEQDGVLSQKLLMRAAQRLRAPRLFKKTSETLLKKLHSDLPSETHGLHENLLVEYQVLAETYFDAGTVKFTSKMDLLPQTITALNHFDTACKLFFACEVYSRRQFLKEELALPDIEQTVAFAREHLAAQNVIIQLYLKVFSLLRNGRDDAQFEATTQLLFKSTDQLGKKEMQALLGFLTTHANQVYKAGETSYLRYILGLHLSGLRHGLMTENGEMLPGIFSNIVNTAVLCKRFSFAHSFIRNCQGCLPKGEKKGTVDLALAFLHFHKGDFKNAFVHAFRSDLTSPRYAYITKPLILRSNYEELTRVKNAHHATVLNTNLEAFKKYIARDRTLSNASRESYKLFCLMLHSMAHALVNGGISTTTKKRLQKMLQKDRPPFARDWLELKIRNLPISPKKRQPVAGKRISHL